jgi:RNase P/RNase MRP subunit p30
MYGTTSVICENLSQEERKHKLDVYRFVGYNILIVTLTYSPSKDYRVILQEIRDQTLLIVHGKILLKPKSIKNLKNILPTLTKYSEFLISVQSVDKDILTFSINDSRVDSIQFPNISELSCITPGIISLLKSNKKVIEISLKDALSSKPQERSRLFHEMHKFLALIKDKDQLIAYGGSEDSVYDIRGPHEIISIFTALFDRSISCGKILVKSNPERICLMLNERAHNPDFTKDVKIVGNITKEGK